MKNSDVARVWLLVFSLMKIIAILFSTTEIRLLLKFKTKELLIKPKWNGQSRNLLLSLLKQIMALKLGGIFLQKHSCAFSVASFYIFLNKLNACIVTHGCGFSLFFSNHKDIEVCVFLGTYRFTTWILVSRWTFLFCVVVVFILQTASCTYANGNMFSFFSASIYATRSLIMTKNLSSTICRC